LADALHRSLQQALDKHYTVERELGGGGMSRVFVATDNTLNRRVVVKVLPPELALDVNTERFRREIQLAAGLQHLHIVPVLASGQSGGNSGEPRLLYYTMPFVEGESLRQLIRREGALPVDAAVRIIREIADALAAAHAAGVVHRDLKPENVLLSRGHALVADFGIAKALDRAAGHTSAMLTTSGLILGTPAYMSPEQAAGDPNADHRADLYSLGVVGYELLTGSLPFGQRAPQQMLVAHAVEPAPPVTKSRPEVGDGVASLIASLLAKRPDDRPVSAESVLRALDGLGAAGGGLPPMSSDSWRSAASSGAPGSRNRARVFAGLLLAGVLVAAMMYRARTSRDGATASPPGTVTAPAAAGLANVPEERSIAVLPLVNLSGDKENEFFSDGMTDELINALAKVEGLRVAARTSAFAFKGKDVDAREIAERLRVRTLLEGSVRRAGNRMRVSVQLINAANGYNLWSDEYDRDVSDVFRVQDEISRAIVGKLKVHLVADSAAPLVRASTGNVEAYSLYLRGRYFYEKRTEEGLVQAVRAFELAIAKDSSFARAWSGLADSYALLGIFGYRRQTETYDKAKVAALHALRIDSTSATSAESHTSLALIRLFYEWNWDGASAEFDRAIALDPHYVPARLFHMWYYIAVDRPEDAVREIDKGIKDDPLSLILGTRKASALRYGGRLQEAHAQILKTLELDAKYSLAHSELSRILVGLHRCDEAMAEIGRIGEQGAYYEGAGIGYTTAFCGKREQALQLVPQLERSYAQARAVAEQLSLLYAGLGDKDRAIQWLERAHDDRRWSMFLIRREGMFDSLRGDPRFQRIVDEMHFPPSTRSDSTAAMRQP